LIHGIIQITATDAVRNSAIVTAHHIPLLPVNSGSAYSKMEDNISPHRSEITVDDFALVTDCRYAIANILIAIGRNDIA